MSEIRFYHLERQTLDQVLPQLLTKALSGGHRVIVKTANDQETQRLNTHLWAYDPSSFLPHGSAKDGHETDQPVFITTLDENPNEADVIILTQGTAANDLEQFKLVCDMIDGRNNEAIQAARARWKTYKDAGHTVTYWQQSPEGRWNKKE
ncbi:MAG: DNA polymerase III subunit chi [Alphaproteobacteria bacterium]